MNVNVDLGKKLEMLNSLVIGVSNSTIVLLFDPVEKIVINGHPPRVGCLFTC